MYLYFIIIFLKNKYTHKLDRAYNMIRCCYNGLETPVVNNKLGNL